MQYATKMPNYQLGKIYKLINSINSKIYVGSSALSRLTQRFSRHKNHAKNSKKQSLIYTEMRTLGVENFCIDLIEIFPCSSKKELLTREQYWIDELKPELNELRSITDPDYKKKYCVSHKEKISAQRKEHRKNPEIAAKIKERQSRKFTCECGREILLCTKIRHCKTQFHQSFIQNLNIN